MANAAPLGAIAIGQTRLLESQHTVQLQFQFESDIDAGLTWWYRLEQFPLYSTLNLLSGEAVVPEYETYVRRLATYRKAHPSPPGGPRLVEGIVESAKESDPVFAAELAEGEREYQHAMNAMLEKYAQ